MLPTPELEIARNLPPDGCAPAEAERYTRWLATHHYENFNVVSWLLPKHLHQHFYNVYAYCRWSDDLGDEVSDAARALELLDYTNYAGDYEEEMGIGKPPEHKCILEIPDVLALAWGATIPMIGRAAGVEVEEITTTWEKWVTDHDIPTARGVVAAGCVAAVRFTVNGMIHGQPRICLEHVNRVGEGSAPDWPTGKENDVYRVEIDGSPSIIQETAFRFTDGSGRDAATAGCLATGLRALNAIPAVNDLPAGWVTALDLPLIAGKGTIR